jgi:hypothetical protein
MPILKPKAGQTEQEYISACISSIIDEYDAEGQAYAVCKATYDKENMSDKFAEYKTLPMEGCKAKMKSDGYTDQEIEYVCNPQPNEDEAQQGGVVSSFARTKFEFLPQAKEQMTSFMSRCMSNDLVKQRKQNRSSRAAFCYSQYQNKYLSSLAKRWK